MKALLTLSKHLAAQPLNAYLEEQHAETHEYSTRLLDQIVLARTLIFDLISFVDKLTDAVHGDYDIRKSASSLQDALGFAEMHLDEIADDVSRGEIEKAEARVYREWADFDETRNGEYQYARGY
jgi:hypothetical protein